MTARPQRKKMVCLSDYVTPVTAAAIIGCTKGRVYQMINDGEIPKSKLAEIGPRRYLIYKKEAERIKATPAKTGRPRKAMAS
jgi:excisionase family DNA binding protein